MDQKQFRVLILHCFLMNEKELSQPGKPPIPGILGRIPAVPCWRKIKLHRRSYKLVTLHGDTWRGVSGRSTLRRC
ncbi:hypothetical protein GWI33_003172 [Rhynchophorus ferrugineus]|uniref:Uncharacterized protein n=1 Tax=Rhynchophorus ferrugineus TaxID=354439 RepID=A0A834MN24_RHYFE|nr:hypothetical protein GWI33_003172 [Rhynchophorus ferrugineus]